MLLNIGDRTKKILGIVLFVPIIGSFLVWGISDMIKAAGAPRYAATVGNITISTQEFNQAYARQLDGMRRQGIKIDGTMAKSLGIGKSVLQSLIQRELLLQAAHDNGIVIGDDIIAEQIKKEKAFYDDAGKFNKDKFKAMLANAGISEQQFTKGLRDDMAIRLLIGALQQSAVPPAALPRALYVLQKSEYNADVYSLPHDAMQATRAPTDDELKRYYDAHHDHYQRPELRRATVATLSLTSWQSNLKPSDSEIQDIYKSHQAEFTIPEERSAQFVIMPDQAKAQAVAERARGGEKLMAAASAVAGTPVALKTMENVKPGTLPGELDQALFKLPRGETSQPVNTSLGWYVLQITNIKAGAVVPMNRIRDKIVASWKQDQAAGKLPKLLNQLDDGIAGGSSLEELAKTYGLQLRQLPLLDASGHGVDARVSADRTLQEILAAAFKQNQGEVGNVFELHNGDYAVLRVDELRPASVPPLTEIRDVVTADWKKSNQRQLAEEAARKLANDWRKDDNVAAAAQKIGAILTAHHGMNRTDIEKAKKTSPIESAILRTGAPGEVVTATDGGNEYIAKIRSIVPPAPASITDAVLGTTRTAAVQAVQNDYVQLFLNALEKHYAVEVNEKVISQTETNTN